MKNILTKLVSSVAALAVTAGLSFAAYQASVDGIGLGSTAAPVLSACGTAPTIVGNDMAGTVTTGTCTPTGCVITFNSAKSSAPVCIVEPIVLAPVLAAASYATSATAITITQTGTNSVVYKYICMGL